MEEPPPQRVLVSVSTRSLLRVLVTATAFLLILFVLWQVRSVLELVLVSGFLALALNPLVTALQKAMGGRRTLATIVVMLLVLVFVTLFLVAVLTPLYTELRNLVERAPVLLRDVQDLALLKDLDARFGVIERLSETADTYANRLPDEAGSLLGVASAVLTGLGKVITIFFMTLFILLEIPRFVTSATELLRPQHADRSLEVFTDVNLTIARWTGGVLLLGTIAGTTVGVSAWLLGVPFALALALIVGVLDLIPLIGATVGSAIAVLVAFTTSMTAGVVMLVLAVIYQLLENHVLQPIIMRRTVDVSPFIVLVSVLIGASLVGVVGALLAIPIAGSVQVVLRRILEARRSAVAAEREALPATAGGSGRGPA